MAYVGLGSGLRPTFAGSIAAEGGFAAGGGGSVQHYADLAARDAVQTCHMENGIEEEEDEKE